MKELVMEDKKPNPLLSVEEFKKKHMPPINIRWAIQKSYCEMVESGALLWFGRKNLSAADAFGVWLREKGREDA